MSSLRAGTARTIITPPTGIDLTGYAGRPTGCTGVHDELYAKALVLSDGETSAAMVSVDLLSLTVEQIACIRDRVSARCGIPGQNILIGASHTHSGPSVHLLRACGCPDGEYVEELLTWIVDAIEVASWDLQPVRFGFGTARTDIAVNRRHPPSEDGAHPGGVTDPEVGVWSFTDERGGAVAVIFSHACHAVVMGGDNLLVSADWPGAAARSIEERVGGQAMFFQGCCGNINPGDRGSFEVVESVGARVADAVLSILPDIGRTPEARIDIRTESVSLPLQSPPPADELEKIIMECEEHLHAADDSTPIAVIQINEAYREWAERLLAMGDSLPREVGLELQRLSLGDAHLLAIPGEVFAEYSLNMKKLSPNVTVVGYANGNIGYIPTQDAYAEGGYEVCDAYRLYGDLMLAPESEEIILQAAGRLLEL